MEDTYLAGLTNPTDMELTFKIIHIGFSNKKKQSRENVVSINVKLLKMQLSRSSCENLSGALPSINYKFKKPIRWNVCNTRAKYNSF